MLNALHSPAVVAAQPPRVDRIRWRDIALWIAVPPVAVLFLFWPVALFVAFYGYLLSSVLPWWAAPLAALGFVGLIFLGVRHRGPMRT